MTTTVLVAEDESLVRAGCVLLLGTAGDIEVVGEATNGEDALMLARTLRPHVVLMDLRMPVLNGIEATRAIVRGSLSDGAATPRVLVLTSFNEENAVQQTLAAGASGFLLKQAAPSDLVAAVRHCAAGDGWLDPAVVGRVLSVLRDTAPPRAPPPSCSPP